MTDPFLMSHLEDLEDFWGRKISATHLRESYQAYGHPVEVVANSAGLLSAARISAQRYTQSTRLSADTDIRITLICDRRRPQEDVPADLPGRLRYLAIGPWLLISGEPWFTAVADLDRRRVAAWLSGPMAEASRQVSRYVLDTTTLNMIIHTGIGQLHASCLYRDGRALLLSAPHNTGKSTTAFRLVRQGYHILSDGMTYVRATGAGPELLGYPVGEVKLRPDVLDQFAELEGQGRQLLVRESRKMIYDLREAMPDRVQETSIVPKEIVLVLLARHAGSRTVAIPIDPVAALEGLWPEAVHYDDLTILEQNLDAIRYLLAAARCYQVTIGSDQAALLDVMDGL